MAVSGKMARQLRVQGLRVSGLGLNYHKLVYCKCSMSVLHVPDIFFRDDKSKVLQFKVGFEV